MSDSCKDCLCKDEDIQCYTCGITKSSGLILSLEELREYDKPLDNYDGDDYSESLYIPDEDD